MSIQNTRQSQFFGVLFEDPLSPDCELNTQSTHINSTSNTSSQQDFFSLGTLEQDIQMLGSLKIVEQGQICEICSMFRNEQLVSISSCMHKFCKDCINQYLQVKIAMFEEVRCPHQNCDLPLDENSTVFSNLPIDLEEKYKKRKDLSPHNRGCSDLQCGGSISEQSLFCSQCKKEHCAKCLNLVHSGPCMHEKLRLKRCCRCLSLIEKAQGCNHIKCACGHEFCYVCGEIWTNKHYSCGKNSYVLDGECRCCEFEACCPCWNNFGKILKIVTIVPIWVLLIIPFYVCFAGLMILVLFFYALYGLVGIGLFIYCAEMKIEAWKLVLMIIFLPLTVLYTTGLIIYRGFVDFAPNIPKILSLPCHSIQLLLA